MMRNHNQVKELKINNKKDQLKRTDMGSESEDNVQHLHSIFNAAPLGIGHLIDRKFIRVNDAFCKMLGYSADELIGQDTRVLYCSDDEYQWVGEEKYARTSKYGKESFEFMLKKKDGKLLDVLVNMVPVDQNDKSKGTTFTVMDITQQKESENNLKYRLEFERLITEISTGSW